LHIACMASTRASPAVVTLLVERYPQALREVDIFGRIPLHYVCTNDVPPGVIRLMLEKYPESLSVADSDGWTVLHRACCGTSAPLERIQLFVDQFPTVCLYVDKSKEKRSPYDLADFWRRQNAVIEYMLEATQDAACALIEVITNTKSAVSFSIIENLKGSIPALRDTKSDISALALVQSIRRNLEPEQLRALLRNDDVQKLIKEEKYQSLICGVMKMNKTERKYIQEDPGNKLKGVRVLKAVWDNPDCVFWHLRESPCLC
jgi:hypothetical protein